jgi:hypothetical protein
MEWCMTAEGVTQLIVAGVLLLVCAAGFVAGTLAKWSEHVRFPFAILMLLLAGALVGIAVTSALNPWMGASYGILVRC